MSREIPTALRNQLGIWVHICELKIGSGTNLSHGIATALRTHPKTWATRSGGGNDLFSFPTARVPDQKHYTILFYMFRATKYIRQTQKEYD